jgi:hypothetical protein
VRLQMRVTSQWPPSVLVLTRLSVRLDLFRSRFVPPAQLIGSGSVKRRVAAARQPVAGELAPDRRLGRPIAWTIALIEWA